jgi:Fe-S-cluster-containing dehydrogenase component
MVAKKTVRSGLSAVEEDLFCSECNNACASQPPHTSKEPNISYTGTEKKEREIVTATEIPMYVCMYTEDPLCMYVCMYVYIYMYVCIGAVWHDVGWTSLMKYLIEGK